MKKVKLFCLMFLYCLLTTQLWANDGWVVASEPTSFAASTPLAIKNVTKGNYLSTNGGLVATFNGLSNDEVWVLEPTGEQVDGYDTYFIKSVKEGKYWKDDDFNVSNVNKDGYDVHEYAGLNAYFTENTAEAMKVTVVAAGSADNARAKDGKDGTEGYIFTLSYEIPDNGYGTLFKLGQQKRDIVDNVAMEPYNEDVAWYFYAVTPASKKDAAIATYKLESNDVGSGQYSVESIEAYNKAIQAVKDATDETLDVAIENLRVAFEGIVKITFIFNEENQTATVTCPSGGNEYHGNFVIPETVEKGGVQYVVTTIGSSAFASSSIKSVTIPNSVTSIGGGAFYDCRGLASVTIPNSVTSIGSSAFSGCIRLASIEIPNSVISIGGGAFSGCRGLISITYNDTKEKWASISKGDGWKAFSAFTVYCSDGNIDLFGKIYYTSTDGNIVTLNNSIYYFGEAWLLNNTYENGQGVITCDREVTGIERNAFKGCTNLKSIEIPNSVTSIGDEAFYGCSSLASIEIPSGVTSIGSRAFENCSSLASVTFGENSQLQSIGYDAFSTCSSLASITFGENSQLQSIGDLAFYQCENLASIEIPSGVTSIGNVAFWHCYYIVLDVFAENPPTISDLGTTSLIIVPDESLQAYKEAWSGYAANIIPRGYEADIEVTAQDKSSDVLAKIGEDNIANVSTLKVKGSINGYDIMVMRNKMLALRNLDLSEADIVASDYEYYSGCHTEDSVLGNNSFRDLKLQNVKLPKSIKQMETSVFEGCYYLNSVEMYEGITSIGSSAFSSCIRLASIEIPNSVTSIGSNAFSFCYNLTSITIPNSVTSIGDDIFSYCSGLTSVTMGNNVTSIGSGAFFDCSKLEELKIPSAVKIIGDNAFSGCSNLKKIYTYTIEPTNINQNTFSTWTTATLYVPQTSYYNYYWNTQWSQFATLEEFDPTYDNFYINGDYTLDDETGRIKGDEPEGEFNEGSGFIVEGEEQQSMGDIHAKEDASIIADDNIDIQDGHKLYIEISVDKNRWYFFSFPYDIYLKNITCDGQFIFRYYDGEARAKGNAEGKAAWKDLSQDDSYLHKNKGYIFQTDTKGTLVLGVEKDDVNFKKENVSEALATYSSQNLQDASWNFVGNPYTSYYDMEDLGYDAPLTFWNGSSYEALRPGDDEHHFSPYEAFFVQKPDDTDNVNFDGDKRETKNGKEKKEQKKAKSRAFKTVNPERLLVNVEISNEAGSDKTRVVFNNKKSMAYETNCDASKFMAGNDVPQIFTLDNQLVQYAINERPIEGGRVALGYSASKAGKYTIKAQKMDVDMKLVDNKEKIDIDLSAADYEFETSAGTFSNRFELVMIDKPTDVKSFAAKTGIAIKPVAGGIEVEGSKDYTMAVYNTTGAQVGTLKGDGRLNLIKGNYIAKIGALSAKVNVE